MIMCFITDVFRFLNREIDRVRDLRKTMENLVLHHSSDKNENKETVDSLVTPKVYGREKIEPFNKFSHKADSTLFFILVLFYYSFL